MTVDLTGTSLTLTGNWLDLGRTLSPEQLWAFLNGLLVVVEAARSLPPPPDGFVGGAGI